MLLTPLQGASTQLYAATSPKVDELNLNGEWLIPIARIGKTTEFARDKKSRDAFWALCEKITADK
jgi:hypothetical protein